MRRTIDALLGLVLIACSGSSTGSGRDAALVDGEPDLGAIAEAGASLPDIAGGDAPTRDASDVSDAAPGDAGTSCAWGGAPGQCISLTACAALADHTSFPGECPGPTTIQCCLPTPSVADNPPVPSGYQLMPQAQVTSAMTTWEVAILDAPATYPMFATTTMTFGAQLVLARVEWHPPDFQSSVVHRGVTLYIPV
jgi:hypothetical protein